MRYVKIFHTEPKPIVNTSKHMSLIEGQVSKLWKLDIRKGKDF